MKTLAVMTAAALVFTPCAIWAESSLPVEPEGAIYEWQDADGVRHFSDIGSGTSGETLVAVPSGTVPSEVPSPPVAQDLVRQGYFALKLAEALDLGSPGDEAEAEDLLASVGIAPSRGWIADYPVTPDIEAELRAAVAEAADNGDLGMERRRALLAFDDLTHRFGLPPANDDRYASDRESRKDPVDRYAVERYYYDYGPPVITYYRPPRGYLNLYVWVPFPFWWHDFFFGGYYILSDFHIVIRLNHSHSGRDFRVIHHDLHRGTDQFSGGRPIIITNHRTERNSARRRIDFQREPIGSRHSIGPDLRRGRHDRGESDGAFSHGPRRNTDRHMNKGGDSGHDGFFKFRRHRGEGFGESRGPSGRHSFSGDSDWSGSRNGRSWSKGTSWGRKGGH